MFSFLRTAQKNNSSASDAVQVVSGEVQAMHRITDEVFRMSPSAATLCWYDPTGNPPHAGHYCHVFTNGVALETIESGNGLYPVGSVIVKQKYSTRLAQNTEIFTIMRKMDSGYDDEHGNWEYSVVDSSGKNVLLRGREESCISCHNYYQDTDYVSRVYLNR